MIILIIAAGNGPEKQEILRLIGTLVRGPLAGPKGERTVGSNPTAAMIIDVQDLFVQVTAVIDLTSTLPRQSPDRRGLFVVWRRGGHGWPARSSFFKDSDLRKRNTSLPLSNEECLVPQFRSKIDPHPAVTVTAWMPQSHTPVDGGLHG